MKSQMQAVALIAVFFCLLFTTGYAAVPHQINYQGRLLDNLGNPVTGTVDLTFSIYEDNVTPTALWTETRLGFSIEDGFVDVILGSVNPIPYEVFEGPVAWLAAKVNSDELPRIQLVTGPYAYKCEGVSGDIETNPSQIIIIGRQDVPPTVLIKDDPAVTPTVEESLLLNDLSVALVVDRGAGDIDKVELKADGINYSGSFLYQSLDFTPGPVVFQGTPVDFDGKEAQWLGLAYPTTVTVDPAKIEMKSLTAPPIPPLDLPIAGEPFMTISDDLINQMFASVLTPGRIEQKVYWTFPTFELLSACEIDDHSIKFSDATNAWEIRRSGDDLEFVPPPVAAAGLDLGGLLTVEPFPMLCTFKSNVQVTHDPGSFSRYGGPTTTLRIRSDDVKIEPTGGGAGARATLNNAELDLTDDVPTATARLHRSDGLTVTLTGGPLAYYRADGVQLTGPDAARFGATSRAFSLTRPSNNGALVCTIDDAQDVFYCDLDDDGLRDVSCRYSPSKQLRVASGTELRCEGTLVCESSSTYLGTCTCRSGWYCDANNDATTDVKCEALPTPEFSIAPGTRLACDGLATFDQSVQMNSNLQVNGALLVLGPKAFVQHHPEDPNKEIIYVALEGNEAGTYTRGSAQLKNGVAEIELPEDFHLVTNVDGLTAQITPRGPVNSMLFVESVTPTSLIVKSSNMKDSDVNFDFMVNGVRKGFENHQVIRDKKSLVMNE